MARNVSTWIRTSASADGAGRRRRRGRRGGLRAARRRSPRSSSPPTSAGPRAPSRRRRGRAGRGRAGRRRAWSPRLAEILAGDEPAALFVGGRACRADALVDASRIANTTGAKLLAETFPARLERGAGRVPVDRLAYLAEFAAMQLDGLRHLVLVDTKSPVSFFAYPGKASDLVPEGCTVHVLAGPDGDPAAALAALADAVGARRPTPPRIQAAAVPDLPTGPLTADAVCQALGALLPEGAIVSDEGNTSGLFAAGHTAGAPAHDWLCLTGGAIGQGLPVALGAAVAAPTAR